MRHRILKLCTALLISAAAWLRQPTVTVSCYNGPDGELVHITCFDPSVLPDSLYNTWFRLAMSDVTGMTSSAEFGPSDEDSATLTSEANDTEWSRYLGGGVPLEDIDAFVYAAPLRDLETMLAAIRARRPVTVPATMAGKRMAQELIRRRDTAALDYLCYAKECEPLNLPDLNGWDAKAPPRPDTVALIRRGLELHARSASPALRLRCAYQLVRAANCGRAPELAVRLYDSLVAPNRTESVVRYYAMFHAYQSLMMLGRPAEGLYLLSRIFDRCPEKRRWGALYYFRVGNEENWRKAYALARTSHERSVLWMMRGMVEYTLDITPMAEMLRQEPRDPRADVMLMREVREVERRVFSYRETRRRKKYGMPAARGNVRVLIPEDWTYFTTDPWRQQGNHEAYPLRLAAFVERSADRRLVADRALWYAVAGYLRIMTGGYAAADRSLDLAGKLVRGNERLALQIRALRLLRRIRSGRSLPTSVVSDYTDALTWMDRYRSEFRRYAPALSMLGQKLLRQGDVPRAAAAFAKGRADMAVSLLLDVYATDRDLRNLQNLLDRPRRRPLDTFLFNRFPYTAADIVDLRATRAMRRGRFAEAVALWRMLERRYGRAIDSVDTTIAPDSEDLGWGREYARFHARVDTTLPFEPGFSDDRDLPEYTRGTFALEMLRLRRLAARNRRSAPRYYYAIARALRSTPYWGYSHRIWDGQLLWTLRYFSPLDYPFNQPVLSRRMARAQMTFLQEYGSNELARSYFERARRATRDRELAADCVWRMIDALKHPQTSYHTPPLKDPRDFALLRSRYGSTMTVRSARSTCALYEAFSASRYRGR